MDREELKSFIEIKVDEISRLDVSNKNKVIQLAQDVLNQFNNFDSNKFNSDVQKDIFDKCRKEKVEFVLNEIGFIRNDLPAYENNNFKLIRLSLMNLRERLY